MKLRHWNILFCIIIISVVIFIILAPIFIRMGYYFHSGKPEPSMEIGIALDSQDNLHIVWYFNQIEDGGHNMVGIWYMKLGQDGNIIQDKKRIINDYANDPKLAIDKNNTIHIIWRTDDNLFKRPYGEYRAICYHYDLNLNYIDKYDLDKFYFNMTAIEIINLNGYNYEFKNNTSGMALNHSEQFKLDFPPNPVCVIDSMDNIHIIRSTSMDIYYTKMDASGNTIISDKKLDCVPDCHSVLLISEIFYIMPYIIITIIVIWIIGIIIIQIKKKKSH